MISHSWESFDFQHAYWKSTVLMMTGGILGVLFVSLMRRAMVEDPELPFPESVAAAEIHKAGQQGARAAKYLFWNMGFGAIAYLLGAMKLFLADKDFLFPIGQLGSSHVRVGAIGSTNNLNVGGYTLFSAPSVSPAYLGVGYIIGPRLASLNFAGGVFAWGLMVPLLIYFMGPQLQAFLPPGSGTEGWEGLANAVWRYIVRPIAVGGMLVGAAYTLFRMRNNLFSGLRRAFAELRQAGGPPQEVSRTEQYMSSKVVLLGILLVSFAMAGVYIYFSGRWWGNRGRGRDADHRIFLRRRIGQPGGLHRLLQ
jgi:Predicted membrane protein